MRECKQENCRSCFADEVEICPLCKEPSLTTLTIPGEKTIVNRYDLLKRLGEGAFGVVYLAHEKRLNQLVAVKILAPHLINSELISRFDAEARAAANINHPNVVKITDSGKNSRGIPFLVMEYMEAGSLSDQIELEDPMHEGMRQGMRPGRVLEIMIPVCKGVAAAHKSGVIHRDLKPENVLISDKESDFAFAVKVTDFGVATVPQEILGSLTPVENGKLIGTPNYMAPELWQADAKPTVATDIYALGVMFYQLLSGELPFKGDSLPALMAEHRTERRSDFGDGLPAEFKDIVIQALDINPEARPSSVSNLIELLQIATEFSALEEISRGITMESSRQEPENDAEQKEIKLIVCDIEGCLMPPNRQAMHGNELDLIEAYCLAAGDPRNELPPLVFCSGRQIPYAECLAQMIGAFFPGFPSVVENGSFLYDIANNRLLRNPVLTDELIEELKDMRGKVDWIVEHYGAVKEAGKEICISINPPPKQNIDYFAATVKRELAPYEGLVEIVNSRSAVDITPKGVDKGSGVRFLAENVKIPTENMLGIGDSGGDKPMLEVVGTAIGPANADPEIQHLFPDDWKAILKADADNEEERDTGPKGVVKILERYTTWKRNVQCQ